MLLGFKNHFGYSPAWSGLLQFGVGNQVIGNTTGNGLCSIIKTFQDQTDGDVEVGKRSTTRSAWKCHCSEMVPTK